MEKKEWLIYNKGKYEDLFKKIQSLGYEVFVPYTRHSSFNGEKCDLCGSDKLIHPRGRYVIFNPDIKDKEVFLCGSCTQMLEEFEILNLDYM